MGHTCNKVGGKRGRFFQRYIGSHIFWSDEFNTLCGEYINTVIHLSERANGFNVKRRVCVCHHTHIYPLCFLFIYDKMLRIFLKEIHFHYYSTAVIPQERDHELVWYTTNQLPKSRCVMPSVMRFHLNSHSVPLQSLAHRYRTTKLKCKWIRHILLLLLLFAATDVPNNFLSFSFYFLR